MGALTDGEREIMQESNNDAAAGWTTDDADDTFEDQERQAEIAASEASLEAQESRNRTDAATDEGDSDHEPF